MKPLSVLHISTETGWRGGEQQVKLLTDGLVKLGHKVQVMSPPGAALLGDRVQAGIGMPMKVRFGEWDFIAVRQICKVARDMNADLIHAQTSHAHSLGLQAARRLNLPLVVSRRVDFAPGGNWWSKRKYINPYVSFIAISKAVGNVLIQAGVDADRVQIVNSGVNPDRFRQRGETRDEELARHWGAESVQPLIVNAAALTDHKDQATLLRAAAILKEKGQDFKLVIAGSGELEAELKNLHLELQLGNAVSFAGYVKDMNTLYSAADVFVISSHLEGLCTSILDAMSVGVPVVATRTGGIPEIVSHEVNGLLSSPRDPADLANQLQRLLNDSEMQRRFMLAGRNTVLDRFTNERMVVGTVAAYRKILS